METMTHPSSRVIPDMIVAHRRLRKASEAFSVLVAQGKLDTISDVHAVIDSLQYGTKVLDDLAAATGRKTFSRDTAHVLRDLLSQHARDLLAYQHNIIV